MIAETLSHYHVLRKLGEGGMGEVYLAEDGKLRRKVAVKLLPAAMAADADRLSRLQREAQAIAALNHPNIVTIYAIEDVGGKTFLVMEFVDGTMLSDFIPLKGLNLEHFFSCAVPLADALSAAHERGVVHRDLKPTNIMVTADGTMKILDFGLAKLRLSTDAQVGSRVTTDVLTAEHQVVGTIPYMAPELLQGKEADHRSDIFSLGVILYQMATGKQPFRGQTSVEIASAILRDTPSPVDDLKAELPHHLGRIIRHCLEKEPEQRLQSAKDLRNDLEDLKREMLTGSRDTRVAVVRAASRRRRLAITRVGGAVLGTLLLAAIIWVLASQQPAAPEAVVSLLPKTGELVDQAMAFEQRGDTKENLSEAEDRYRRALGLEPDNPHLKARLAAVLTRLEMQYDDPERREETRRLSEEALADMPNLALAHIALGRLELVEGEPEAAEAAARKALQLDPHEYRGHTLLGRVLLSRQRTDEGFLELRRGVELAGPDLRARLALAKGLLDQKEYAAAEAEYSAVRDYDPDNRNALNNLGNVLYYTHRCREAIPLYRRALDLDQTDETAANGLGACHFSVGNLDDAVAAYEHAHRLDPANPSPVLNLGEAHERRGDNEAAMHWYRRAVETYDEELARRGKQARTLARRALCLAKLGDVDEARIGIGDALALRGDSGSVLFLAAQVHAIAGERDALLEYVERAIGAGIARQEIYQDLAFAAWREDPGFKNLLETEVGRQVG